MEAVIQTAIPGLEPPRRGKVREVYDLGDELLIVATDRISAFDVILPQGIPGKGQILTQMSAFWFDRLAPLGPHHLVSTDDALIASRVGDLPELHGRSSLARKAQPLPIEAVVRGYLTGSLYKEYQRHGGMVHGLALPDGLLDGSQLREPIFTPATKASEGHDENISWAQTVDLIGQEVAERVREWSLALYERGLAHAQERGIILADTKFEFGLTDGGLILIDEVLTPDSSRYWSAESWTPGQAQPSFDKQYVRDYLETLHWDKKPPGPDLPASVVAGTQDRYREAFRRIVGHEPKIG